jgi:hypothetical protein
VFLHERGLSAALELLVYVTACAPEGAMPRYHLNLTEQEHGT